MGLSVRAEPVFLLIQDREVRGNNYCSYTEGTSTRRVISGGPPSHRNQVLVFDKIPEDLASSDNF